MGKSLIENVWDANAIKSTQGVEFLYLDRHYNFRNDSSREHTAWALYDYSFRVVASSFFANRFNTNALKDDFLTTQLDTKNSFSTLKK